MNILGGSSRQADDVSLAGICGTTTPTLGIMKLSSLDNIIRGIFYVYCFSLPFKSLLFVERIGFIILTCLVIVWCLLRKRFLVIPLQIALPVSVFIGWIGITIPWAAFPGYSLGELEKFVHDIFVLSVVIMFFREPSDLRRLLQSMVVSLVAMSMLGIGEFILSPPGSSSAWSSSFRAGSAVGGNMWLSSYLLILIPIASCLAFYTQQFRARILYGSAAVLGLTCMLLSFSSAGIVAVIIQGFMAGMVLRQWRVIVAMSVLSVCLLGGAFAYKYSLDRQIKNEDASISPRLRAEYQERDGTVQEYNLRARLNILTFGLRELGAHPLVGVGFGKNTFDWVYGKKTRQLHDMSHPMPGGTHNTFLDLALGIGLPGVAIFIWLLIAITRMAISTYRAATCPLSQAVALAVSTIVVGIAVRNFFDHMFAGNIAILFWVAVATCCVVALWHQEPGQREEAGLP